MSSKETVLIIVTWNGRAFCEELFAGLEKDSKHGLHYSIIVVDNASTDGTVDWIREHASYVELICSSRNTGFTGGNTIAMARALEKGASFVVLLNQDMIIEPGFVDELVGVAKENSNAGAVGALMLLAQDRTYVNSWGNEIHYLGFGYAGGYRKSRTEVNPEVHPITNASGGAVLYRMDVLRTIGFFPEHFFMYQEDVDMGWRMRLAGYETLLAPEAVVYHQYDWKGSAAKYAMVERNRLATVLTNYHWASLLVLTPALLASEIGLFVFSLFTGWWRGKLNAWKLLFDPAYVRATWLARKRAQHLRIRPDREVTRVFTSVIAFQEVDSPVVQYVLNPLFTLYWKFVRMLMFW